MTHKNSIIKSILKIRVILELQYITFINLSNQVFFVAIPFVVLYLGGINEIELTGKKLKHCICIPTRQSN